MQKKSLRSNVVYQLLYQIIMLVLPLIISPILTRRLGRTSLGTYTYVNSIAYYFVLFANLGISRYGQRLIAEKRNDEIALRKSFWSLFFIHNIISILVVIVYCLFIFLFVQKDTVIYWLNIIYILSAMVDITWLFYGLENFGNVVVKNLLARIASFLFIFLLVRSSKDLPIYTIVETTTLLVGNLLLIPAAIKYIPFIRFNVKDSLCHLKPMSILAISALAITMYTVFDKILLGVMTNKDNVALFEYSNKIISIPKAFVAVVGTVFFPRACALVSERDYEGQKRYANYAYLCISSISFASIYGLIAIGPQFATLYYGNEFSACGNIIIAMTPLILIIGIGDIARNIYLIPEKKDGWFVICYCISAFLNIVLSSMLIPVASIYGALIGTITAELFGLFFQIYLCRRRIDFYALIKSIIVFASIGLIMFLCINVVGTLLGNSIILIALKVLLGGIIYTFVSLIAIKVFYSEIWIILKKFMIQKIKNQGGTNK